MNKYFVTKGLVGFHVIYEAFDKFNGGNHYVSVSEEYDTEDKAQDYADKLNKEI
ncbi:hypothetical protein WKH57_01065 [Niallia taxi]|uniref:hypothetical protein n=1 Tax=Niallia taxi TaxID=2499688 RepID=UPI00316F8B83